jgi:hypothetical protein
MERLVLCPCGHAIGVHTADGCGTRAANGRLCGCGSDAYGVIEHVLVVDDEIRRRDLDVPVIR